MFHLAKSEHVCLDQDNDLFVANDWQDWLYQGVDSSKMVIYVWRKIAKQKKKLLFFQKNNFQIINGPGTSYQEGSSFCIILCLNWWMFNLF